MRTVHPMLANTLTTSTPNLQQRTRTRAHGPCGTRKTLHTLGAGTFGTRPNAAAPKHRKNDGDGGGRAWVCAPVRGNVVTMRCLSCAWLLLRGVRRQHRHRRRVV